MPVIRYGHIVPRQQKRLNPPTGSPSPNPDDTITNPTRDLITPINPPSHLNRLTRNHRRILKNRSDRRPKILLKTLPNSTNIVPIQGNPLTIRPISKPSTGTTTPPTPNQTPRSLTPIGQIAIGKMPTDRIRPGIKPITRLPPPINRRPTTPPMGTPPSQPKLSLNRQRLINLLQ